MGQLTTGSLRERQRNGDHSSGIGILWRQQLSVQMQAVTDWVEFFFKSMKENLDQLHFAPALLCQRNKNTHRLRKSALRQYGRARDFTLSRWSGVFQASY